MTTTTPTITYTPAQSQAINTLDQNLQIIACAGSGKTQVISARIVNLLAAGVPPAAIVAFTFTEKAAAELQDRIDRLCLAQLGHNIGLGDMYVGTIHGYCLQMLQSPPLYRYLKYRVLDDVQQRLLIDRHSSQSGLTSTPLLNGSGTLKRWLESRLYQSLLSILIEGDVDFSQVPPPVIESLQSYRQLLHDHNLLDYSTILSEAVQELETNPILQEQLSSQIQHLVVDEYQDVNPLQERLIRKLHELGATLCVVGDDDQTIYQWRGSDVSNIITFAQRYPDVAQVKLNENFRSSSAIITAARGVIERNPERLPKRMESVDAQPADFGDLLALQFPDPQSEAEWIAEKIKALYGTPYRDRPDREPRGLSYSDFAILLRSVRHDAGTITAAFDRAKIPYLVGGTNGLFDTPEIQALCTVYSFMGDFAPNNQPPPTEPELRHALQRAFFRTPQQLDQGMAYIRRVKADIGPSHMRHLHLQRFLFDLLEALELREENLQPTNNRTAEIIFYNLGKFSQVITDFEQIHFFTPADALYNQFASFLHYQAPDYYPEGWEEAGYAQIDAVQILTVHRAKGMQWPVVFVPCLRNNRFPSKRQGGRSVWHIIPDSAVPDVDRYKGTREDERRLFYVAATRAERYLFCSYSPVPGKNLYNKLSPFQLELTSASTMVLTDEPPSFGQTEKLPPQPRREAAPVVLSFSELKYFFECPYSFKLRFLYGFDNPVDPGLGYGKSLHNMLAEIHAESIRGQIPDRGDIERLVDEHLFLPFASGELTQSMQAAATGALDRYLDSNSEKLTRLEHVEKPIELRLGDGIVVNGRIDLIRRTDTGHVSIVDFKSTRRAQAENITLKQLQIYALGYQQLTNRLADLIEVHNLDDGGVDRSVVNPVLIDKMVSDTTRAGRSIRDNALPRLDSWCKTCHTCDFSGICRNKNGSSKG